MIPGSRPHQSPRYNLPLVGEADELAGAVQSPSESTVGTDSPALVSVPQWLPLHSPPRSYSAVYVYLCGLCQGSGAEPTRAESSRIQCENDFETDGVIGPNRVSFAALFLRETITFGWHQHKRFLEEESWGL